jgi:hypothetical protein
MAKNYTEILALANKNNMGLSNTIKRDYGIPLDYSSVQESYEKALEYAQSSTLAYIGQPISVGDVLYVVTTPENGYLKQVGVKPVGDNKSIEVSEEGVVSVYGFEAAEGATLPQKQADGTIKWVAISAIVEGDGNTKTVVKAADGSDITVTPVYDEVNDTYTYTLDVQFPAIPEYSVEKVEGENEVTYKVTKDGVQVGESIVVPNAFDPSEILESIETLQGYFTEGEANVAVEAKGYVADGAIDTEFKRLAGLINGLAGVDTTFTQDLKALKDSFDAFMEGSGAENVIDSLADIKTAIEALQAHSSTYEVKVDQVVEDVEDIKGRLDVIEAIEHHEHENKAELDKIVEGDVEKWNSLVNYDDSEIRGLIEPKADKTYVDDELAKKVDADGYVAYSQEEKDKLSGLENYNDSDLRGRIESIEGTFTNGVDAATLGGQLPEYYATKASVEEAISGVHSHENKDVLDGISSSDIENWNAAEQNAKSYSDSKLGDAVTSLEGKITAEQTRAEGIEAGFETRIKTLEDKEPTKVEVSETNGNIKVDGEEVKVYDDSSLVSRLEVVEGKPFDTYAIKSEVETALSGKVDNSVLDNYYTKGETETKISEMITEVNTNVGESAAGVLSQLNAHKTDADEKFGLVNTAIKANTDAIAVLNGTGEGSVSKQVVDAIAEVVAEAPEAFDTLKEIADYIAGDKTNAAELLNKVNANTEAIAAEVKRAGDKEVELAGLISNLDAAYKAKDIELVAEDERLAGLIQGNTNLINTLNGDGEGSVNKKIADAIASIPAIPAATASALGLVKVGETMSVDSEGTINVSKVSTDMLVQGEQELVLMGGSAK